MLAGLNARGKWLKLALLVTVFGHAARKDILCLIPGLLMTAASSTGGGSCGCLMWEYPSAAMCHLLLVAEGGALRSLGKHSWQGFSKETRFEIILSTPWRFRHRKDYVRRYTLLISASARWKQVACKFGFYLVRFCQNRRKKG